MEMLKLGQHLWSVLVMTLLVHYVLFFTIYSLFT